jgi:hypothetical protein
MFDRLDAPADLGSARARLAAEAERRAGSATVHHLGASAGWSDPGLAEAGVVVADSVLWQASEAQLAALAAALGPERSLLFLEPTADLGWRRLVHRIGRTVWRRVAGHDFETDVPVRLRGAGLEVVDVRRFGVGRGQLRSYAIGRAIGFSSR